MSFIKSPSVLIGAGVAAITAAGGVSDQVNSWLVTANAALVLIGSIASHFVTSKRYAREAQDILNLVSEGEQAIADVQAADTQSEANTPPAPQIL